METKKCDSRLLRFLKVLTLRDTKIGKWKLLNQFMFFIIILFLFFYIVFISYLLPFTLKIFAESNLNSI